MRHDNFSGVALTLQGMLTWYANIRKPEKPFIPENKKTVMHEKKDCKGYQQVVECYIGHLRKPMAEIDTRVNLTSVFWLVGSEHMWEDFKSVLSKLTIPAVKMHSMPIFTRPSLCDALLQINRTLHVT
jgi:hypothetical protein